jgi:hypothetical protein
MDKHPPEPWKGPCAPASNFDRRATIKTADGEIVVWLSKLGECHARLIAAAPEVVAKAEKLLCNTTFTDGVGVVRAEYCAFLAAAIAKATGVA